MVASLDVDGVGLPLVLGEALYTDVRFSLQLVHDMQHTVDLLDDIEPNGGGKNRRKRERGGSL